MSGITLAMNAAPKMIIKIAISSNSSWHRWQRKGQKRVILDFLSMCSAFPVPPSRLGKISHIIMRMCQYVHANRCPGMTRLSVFVPHLTAGATNLRKVPEAKRLIEGRLNPSKLSYNVQLGSCSSPGLREVMIMFLAGKLLMLSSAIGPALGCFILCPIFGFLGILSFDKIVRQKRPSRLLQNYPCMPSLADEITG